MSFTQRPNTQEKTMGGTLRADDSIDARASRGVYACSEDDVSVANFRPSWFMTSTPGLVSSRVLPVTKSPVRGSAVNTCHHTVMTGCLSYETHFSVSARATCDKVSAIFPK